MSSGHSPETGPVGSEKGLWFKKVPAPRLAPTLRRVRTLAMPEKTSIL